MQKNHENSVFSVFIKSAFYAMADMIADIEIAYSFHMYNLTIKGMRYYVTSFWLQFFNYMLIRLKIGKASYFTDMVENILYLRIEFSFAVMD